MEKNYWSSLAEKRTELFRADDDWENSFLSTGATYKSSADEVRERSISFGSSPWNNSVSEPSVFTECDFVEKVFDDVDGKGSPDTASDAEVDAVDDDECVALETLYVPESSSLSEPYWESSESFSYSSSVPVFLARFD